MKQPPSASLALWAEDNDIPAADLAKAYNLPLNSTNIPTGQAALEEPEEGGNRTELGKYIAMDCEMVGVGEGDRESSALARVSIVNFHGHCVLDLFVKPKEKVTDWRTWVSGVSPKDMEHAVTFEEAQKRAAEIMDGRILIGHAIKNDLECLLIGHPKRDIRDTSKHPDFKKYSKGRTPGLKKLAKEILGIEIQGGQHSSIEDARACMLLYRRFKEDFERENQIRFPLHAKKPGAGKKKKKNKK
ncbi:ribonuclease H-like domain-containing protein [Pyronema omphalodes]|nr:ribonuclease H-like domain-containing protein [Pyronema omphalodes]